MRYQNGEEYDFAAWCFGWNGRMFKNRRRSVRPRISVLDGVENVLVEG
jgi:hypothetical protein